MIESARALEAHLQGELGKVLFGVADAVHAIAIALIGRGHVLLEGPPGVGKTLLSKSLARVLGGNHRRIQGTADLMPADITGVHVYNARDREFVFQPGPVFADVLLVDEINRAGPRTQSALLEAMEERQVTVDRESFPLADGFLVVATQNPHEFEGTYPLPESQLDRFLLGAAIGYPARDREAEVIDAYNLPDRRAIHPGEIPLARVPGDLVGSARDELAAVHLSADLVGYVLDIAAATRQHERIGLGLSTRGAVALARCARIEAALGGADYVVPDDVKRIAPGVLVHRLVLAADAALEGVAAARVVAEILDAVPVPK